MSDELKVAAGRAAARFVEDGMRVGLGTGSTVEHTILELGERRPDIVCVATSERTYRLARELGLRVEAPGSLIHLDVAVDGADEVDPALNLVKGGGGAHVREKIVATMAARFVVVVDESKLVPRLGAFGLPVEVLDFGADVVADRLLTLGATGVSRRPVPSDNGNPILDATFGEIADPVALDAVLDAVPGVVGHGIFPAAMVERVVVGAAAGVRELTRG